MSTNLVASRLILIPKPTNQPCLLALTTSTEKLSLGLFFVFQIVIANPKREVLVTLTKAGLVDLIGKEWYFVRVHDAVQICLQHVQGGPNELPRAPDSFIEGKRRVFQRSNVRKEETVDLESGHQTQSSSTSSDPQLQEPLLPQRS